MVPQFYSILLPYESVIRRNKRFLLKVHSITSHKTVATEEQVRDKDSDLDSDGTIAYDEETDKVSDRENDVNSEGTIAYELESDEVLQEDR